MYPVDPGPDGENVDEILAHLKDLATLGVEHVHTRLPDVASLKAIEIFGEKVIPEAEKL